MGGVRGDNLPSERVMDREWNDWVEDEDDAAADADRPGLERVNARSGGGNDGR